MRVIKQIRGRLKEFHPFSLTAVKVGFGLALCYFIVALFAYYISPNVPSYFRAMLVYREAIKAGTASILVTVISIVVTDIALTHRE